MQMGDYAAKRIKLLQEDNGAAARQKPFRYFDKGDMATIGRKAAVARVAWPFHAHLGGFIAWLMWLVVHIFFLIGLRNRLSVFRSWFWTYVTLRDGVRLIVGSQDLPGWGILAATPAPDTSSTPSTSSGGTEVAAPALP